MRWLKATLSTLALALAISQVASASFDFHAEMNKPGTCLSCHEQDVSFGAQPPRPLKFKKDIVSICLGCHKTKDVASLHPVDIRPGKKMTSELPLDDHKQITCATCHNPHMPAQADEPYVAEALGKRVLDLFSFGKKHPTFFLRLKNSEGQLCDVCHERGRMGAATGFHQTVQSKLGQYAGSAKCGTCHVESYKQWLLTPHAKMTRDPKINPEAVLADFDNNPPFKRSDVVYVLGSRWTQRYVVEKNKKLYVKAPIWSVTGKSWDRSYWVDKQWDQFCQGCHTTGFEMKPDPKFAELAIGCEACHGPGKAHADSGGGAHIVNPAKLPTDRREMICESCHTSGHDISGAFRFPLGYLPGEDLTIYYKGLTPKPGQDNATFMGDGSYEDRRRQWTYWVDSFFNAKGITCDICKNFRERQEKQETETKMTVTDHCLTCHEKSLKKSDTHTRHTEKGVSCEKCHNPMVAPGGERYSIHDHKFYFGKPTAAKAVKTEATCKGCHEKRKDG